jgi:hypothetical protein
MAGELRHDGKWQVDSARSSTRSIREQRLSQIRSLFYSYNTCHMQSGG